MSELIEQARSSDPDARQKAAYAVSHSADDRDYPLMFELLGDKDWRVRKTIVDGFVREPGGQVIDGLIGALADSENAGKRNSATEALIRIGEPAIAPIVENLRRESDVDVRLSLVNLLGDLRSPEGFEILIEILKDEKDINVASSVVSSIGKYRDAGALPHLVPVLRRDDLWLKFHVVEALGEIGDRLHLLRRGVARNAAIGFQRDGDDGIARLAMMMDIVAQPAGEGRGFQALGHHCRRERIGFGQGGRREERLDTRNLGSRQSQRAILDLFPFRFDEVAEFRGAQRGHQDLDARFVKIVAPALEVINAQDRLKV